MLYVLMYCKYCHFIISICIMFSDEGLTNIEHNPQRIQCTRWHCSSWQYGCKISTPLTFSVNIHTELVVMSPMRNVVDAAINTDDIVVPLNSHHDHGYAKLSLQSCIPSSSTDHGSPVNVDVPVSLSPSSDNYVSNNQKENIEENNAECVVADDSDIADDDSSSSDTIEKQRKFRKKNFPFLQLTVHSDIFI